MATTAISRAPRMSDKTTLLIDRNRRSTDKLPQPRGESAMQLTYHRREGHETTLTPRADVFLYGTRSRASDYRQAVGFRIGADVSMAFVKPGAPGTFERIERLEHAEIEAALLRINSLARIMDSLFAIPGTRLRLGVDSILG